MDTAGAMVIDEDSRPAHPTGPPALGSYDDAPEAGVQVTLAVPLVAARPAAAQRPAAGLAPRRAPLPARTHTGVRSGARHRRPSESVVRETVVLGGTAAVVVFAAVVLLLSLVDWLS